MNLVGHDLECKPEFAEPFADILLVIHVWGGRHSPQRESELELLYSCFFPNIVRYTFCNAANETSPGIHCVSDPEPHSVWMYLLLVDAMEQQPHFRGYLFAQDDVLIQFWNFPRRHSLDKVWRAFAFMDPDFVGTHAHLPMYPADDKVFPSIAHYFLATPAFPMRGRQLFVEGFSQGEQARLFSAQGDAQPSFRMANSDMFYLPARFREQACVHFKRAREHRVPAEVAVPILFDAISEPRDWEELFGATLYRIRHPLQKMALFDPCWDYFHKLKPAIEIEFEFHVDQVFRFGPMIATWKCEQVTSLQSYTRVESLHP